MIIFTTGIPLIVYIVTTVYEHYIQYQQMSQSDSWTQLCYFIPLLIVDLCSNMFNGFECDQLTKKNTITGLIGRNGVGKITLLKIIADFYKQTSGEVRVFGEMPLTILKYRKKVFFKKQVGVNGSYIMVKNDFSDELSEQAKQRGVQITTVSAEAVCMYATSKTKGGIDDVFNKR
ncbi:ATP-binding cassette domain-containing protein [Schinkia azotoformans]|uniref:ATP-binding cassette domain-containing protein n=1 Tax=Schinkia azotoformans TaxID=1454 RepID=UPI002DBBDD9D|nr:ATP-binding cassette domain-containing protein [Schinkia azotoformans]MEC1721249.1 ATP-binding cassette domain-containing protein [Schinkia azotoformans]MED4414396.1 ATP-binding cassette domain-containing protein [Schinkia azotoformans]